MTQTYGLSLAGFLAKPFAVVKAEWEASLQGLVGVDVDLQPESVYGQIVGVASERETALWQLLEAIYDSFRADYAQGAQLDTLLGFIDAVRVPATKGTLQQVFTGTPTTVIPAGSFVKNAAGSRWTVDAPAPTIAAVSAWAGAHSYATVGERCYSTLGHVYQVTVPGTSAATGGPTGKSDDIIDGTVHWEYLGDGTGAVDHPTTAEYTGPVGGKARTVDTIASPISGWMGTINLEDAAVGRDIESDAEFRYRRFLLLRAAGKSAYDQVLAAVGKVTNVAALTCAENVGTVTDPSGLPPASFEMVVEGGTDADIAQAIWSNKPVGINTFGDTSIEVADLAGKLHRVSFSRPTDVDVWVWVHVQVDMLTFPADGVTRIKDALATYGTEHIGLGQDVISSRLSAEIYAIPGVVDVHPSPGVGIARYPTEDDRLAVTARQHARLATARVDVEIVS